MRRLFLLLMIALLPLRGWAADVMSIDMSVNQATSQAGASMPADCPMQLGAVSAVQGDEPGPAMQGCASCELCVPATEVGAFEMDVAAFARHAKPVGAEAGFLSATPAPSFKPPIS